MKSFYYFFWLFIFLLTTETQAQIVTTLTTVRANGGITVDAEGNIFAAHFGPLPIVPAAIGKDLFKITPEGEISTFGGGRLNVGTGNDFDADGFLYQANFITNTVFKIAPDGTIVDNAFATVPGPVGVLAREDGTIFICGCGDNTLYQVAPSGDLTPFVAGGFNCVNGITKDDLNNLYVTNFSDGVITRISPDGERSAVGDTGIGNGHITYRSVDKLLYIASYSGNQIFTMDLDGNVNLFAGTGQEGAQDSDDPLQATFTRPNGITISKNRCSIYITQDEDVIREIKFFDGRCDQASNIEELNSATNIRLTPNPSSGILQINNPNNITIETVEVFDVAGKQIEKFDRVGNSLDISKLTKGVYFLILSMDENKQYREKVVIN